MSPFGSRIALLIGIGDYPQLGSLRTPHQDVKLLRRVLRQCGFADDQVLTLTDEMQPVSVSDLRRSFVRLREGIAALGAQQPSAHSCALLYFAGHGVTHAGESYLLSGHAGMGAADIVAEGLPLSEIVRHLALRLDIPKLLFIDACRSPSRARGLETSPLRLPDFQAGDMLLDLAAGPGEIASDGDQQSPYARALSRALVLRDVSINDALTEVRADVRRETHSRQSPQTVTTLSMRLVMCPGPGEQSRTNALIAITSSMEEADSGPMFPRRDFTREEIAGMGHLVHKLRAKDATGQWAYFFVLVEPPFETGFMAAFSGDGAIDLEHYGVVLASSYGKQPTPEVITYLAETYGFQIKAETPALIVASQQGVPIPPATDSTAQRDGIIPSMLVALRQHLGMGQWHWLVMLVAPENRIMFAQAADELLSIDRGGFGTSGKGILSGLREVVVAFGGSKFDIHRLTPFGIVLFRGAGAYVPPSVQVNIANSFGVAFDWSDWERLNGVLADIPLGQSSSNSRQ